MLLSVESRGAHVTERSIAAGGQQQVRQLDTGVPHSARVWHYWLGGKDHFAADREVGDQVRQVYPEIVEVARTSREFLIRAVRYLTGEAGIRQFLDIGTGLPTADNTHEVAQRLAPESRVVYVDNDPMVLVHARALLTSDLRGVTDYIDADVRDPDKILLDAARTLDLGRPVAVMMLGILGNVADYGQARSVVRRLVEAVPSGSHLVVNDGTNVVHPEQRNAAHRTYDESGASPYTPRTPRQIAAFFDGLQLLEPGVVCTPRWRPDKPDDPPDDIDVFCGVGRKL
jgi:S-adenosyl methyltransferase